MKRPPAGLVRDLQAGILPWCLYGLASALGATVLGAVAAALALASLRLGRWREIKVPDLVIFAFFVFVGADACCLKLPLWEGFRAALLPLVLALVAVGSSLMGRPFSLQYARQMVGPDWWYDRHFLRVNHIITVVWGGSFLAAAVLGLVTPSGPFHVRLLAAVAGLALLVATVCFTRVFPRWYRMHCYLPRVRAGVEPYRRAPHW